MSVFCNTLVTFFTYGLIVSYGSKGETSYWILCWPFPVSKFGFSWNNLEKGSVSMFLKLSLSLETLHCPLAMMYSPYGISPSLTMISPYLKVSTLTALARVITRNLSTSLNKSKLSKNQIRTLKSWSSVKKHFFASYLSIHSNIESSTAIAVAHFQLMSSYLCPPLISIIDASPK